MGLYEVMRYDGIFYPICHEIKLERWRQIEEFGGPVHDDLHSDREWCGLIQRHNRRAVDGKTRDDFRTQMIRVAALAVAAIEAFDRKKAG